MDIKQEEQKLQKLKAEFAQLEVQRKESLAGYTNKVSEIKTEINTLNGKLSNLKDTLNKALEERRKDLEDAQEKARNEFSEANKLKIEASLVLQGVNKQKEDLDILHKSLENKEKEHLNNVDMHNKASQEEREEIERTKEECSIIERSLCQKGEEIESKLRLLAEKELEIEEGKKSLADQLEKINKEIAINKAIEESNKALLNEVKEEREKVAEIEKNIIDSKNDIEAIKSDIESESGDLEQKRQEIDRKLTILKNESVKNALDLQKLKDKEKDILNHTAKLNELKNNIDILMDKQGINKGV